MTKIMRFCTAVLIGLAGAGLNGAIAQVAALYGVPYDGPAVKYGPPIEVPGPKTEVTITGTVTAEDGNQAIKGIKVQVNRTDIATTTDADGKYTIKVGIEEGKSVQLKIVDIDGDKNGGQFATEYVTVTLNTNNDDPKDDASQTKDVTLELAGEEE